MANPFWKEVFYALSLLIQAEEKDWLSKPLWKSSSIQIGHESIFFKSWYEKGIRYINDLIDSNGNMLTQEECEKKFSLKLNYLSYYSICRVIKRKYSTYIEKCHKNLEEPLLPSHIKTLMYDIKGCRYMYKVLLGETNGLHSICLKWERHLDYIPEISIMRKYNIMIFRFTQDIRLRYFQYKILNRILFLNKQLFKMKIVNDDKCTFCGKELEDIVHFFYKCEISRKIWNETTNWIYERTQVRIEFTLENIIFGFEDKRNDALNCIVTLIKQQMFIYKLNNKIPSFNIMTKRVLQYYEDEKYIQIISGTYNKFLVKWQALQLLFV